jgi:hypothetical protein
MKIFGENTGDFDKASSLFFSGQSSRKLSQKTRK